MICEADDTEHPHQAESIVGNGQVERMNRTFIVTAKRFHRQSHEQLRTHRADQMAAYSIACRFKMLSGLTPQQYSAQI
jgi:hypothetical protein